MRIIMGGRHPGVLVTSTGMARVAARIHAGGLLRTGGRVRVRDAWAADAT